MRDSRGFVRSTRRWPARATGVVVGAAAAPAGLSGHSVGIAGVSQRLVPAGGPVGVGVSAAFAGWRPSRAGAADAIFNM
jgi:hypothetical protein